MSDETGNEATGVEPAALLRPVVLTSRPVERPSAWRAWWYLVRLSVQRQSRSHQMVWVALILLGLTATIILLNTAADRWGMNHWRSPRGTGPRFDQCLQAVQALRYGLPWAPPVLAIQDSLLLGSKLLMDRSGFFVFSTWIVFGVFMSFLLPVWSMSFATDALGGERESRSLLWLLTRPLPRSSIYLAKFMALLPWSLGLNLGSFAILAWRRRRDNAAAVLARSALRLAGVLLALSPNGRCFRRAIVSLSILSF